MHQHQVVADLRSVLARAEPTWMEVQIVGSLPYLGVRLGPSCTLLEQWGHPMAKLKERTVRIAGAGASVARSAERFLERALPVLGYKARLFQLPRQLAASERHRFARLWHAPSSSMGHGEWLELASWGGP
eukprot:1539674-Pyramimonas_sp.AAC.1